MILLRDELLKATCDTWLLGISLVTRSSLVASLRRCVLRHVVMLMATATRRVSLIGI